MKTDHTNRDWLAVTVSGITAVVLAGSIIAVPCWYAGMQYFSAKSAYFGYPMLTDGMSTYYLIATGWRLVLPQILWSLVVAAVITFVSFYLAGTLFIIFTSLFKPLRRRMEPIARKHLDIPDSYELTKTHAILGMTTYFIRDIALDKSLLTQILLLSVFLPTALLSSGAVSGRDGENAGRHDARLISEMVMSGCSRCYDFRTKDGDIVTGFIVAVSSRETLILSLGELHVFGSGDLKGVSPRQPDRAEAANGG
mgnify:CR=1 FL=1